MFGSIVVGTDGSETAGEAVRQSIELAKAVGAKLNLVRNRIFQITGTRPFQQGLKHRPVTKRREVVVAPPQIRRRVERNRAGQQVWVQRIQ